MDFKFLTDVELDEILASYGLDDLRGHSRANKESILRNMQGENNDTDTQMPITTPVESGADEKPAAMESAIDMTIAADEEALNTAMQESIELTGEDSMDVDVPAAAMEANMPPNNAPPLESSSPQITEEEETKVLMLVEISGCEAGYARNVLMSTDWDLASAVAIFFASEGGGVGGNQNSHYRGPPGVKIRQLPASHFYSSAIGSEAEEMHTPGDQGEGGTGADADAEDDVAGAMERHMKTLQELMNMAHVNMHMTGGGDGSDDDAEGDDAYDYLRRHGVFPPGMIPPPSLSTVDGDAGSADADTDGRRSGTNRNEVDEDGIRIRVDPIRMQRLISRQISHDENMHAMLGRADDPDVIWLVEPPRHLTYMGSLTHAKNKATVESRWLLVNIQSHEQFMSNELNRDTWVDETIVEILHNQYLFWQRGHTTPDGQEFMRLYRINAADLPIIAIIEPNTGAKLAMIQGYVEPVDMAAWLIDFNEKHERMPSPKRPDKAAAAVPSSSSASASADVDVSVRTAEFSAEMQRQLVKESVVAIFDAVGEYGLPSPEPADNDPDMIKVSIRLSSGKRVNRRYRKQDPVRVLFAVAAQEDPANSAQPFDLTIVGGGSAPTVSLLESLNRSLEECNLKGTMVTHKKLA